MPSNHPRHISQVLEIIWMELEQNVSYVVAMADKNIFPSNFHDSTHNYVCFVSVSLRSGILSYPESNYGMIKNAIAYTVGIA